MANGKSTFFCWGVSHHSAPIEYREKISPAPEQLIQIYKELAEKEWLNELTVLSTCNRLEIYGASYDTQSHILASCIASVLQINPSELDQKSRLIIEEEALTHLFSVTAGLDSQIVGEVEITGQVKKAFLFAAAQRTVGTTLNKAFQKSFQTAKWIRSNTNIGKGQINVATVAVDLALKVFGKMNSAKVLVIGAGDIAEKTLAALCSRGVRNVVICNRTLDKAVELANKTNGKAIAFEDLDKFINNADVILCSTASKDFILTEERMDSAMKKRAVHPLCLLDLALPRDIDPVINKFPNVFLYNLDDLAEIADSNLKARKEELGKCQEIIEKKVQALMNYQKPLFIQDPGPRGIQQI